MMITKLYNGQSLSVFIVSRESFYFFLITRYEVYNDSLYTVLIKPQRISLY